MANLSLNTRQNKDQIKLLSKDLCKRMTFEGLLWQWAGDPEKTKEHLSGSLRHTPCSQMKKWESVQLLELFDLLLWDFIQRSLCLSPTTKFHNLIQLAPLVVILSRKQKMERGKNEGGGERRRKQANKVSAGLDILSWKGENLRIL